VAYPGTFFGGGGSTNSVEDRENEDLGAVCWELKTMSLGMILSNPMDR